MSRIWFYKLPHFVTRIITGKTSLLILPFSAESTFACFIMCQLCFLFVSDDWIYAICSCLPFDSFPLTKVTDQTTWLPVIQYGGQVAGLPVSVFRAYSCLIVPLLGIKVYTIFRAFSYMDAI